MNKFFTSLIALTLGAFAADAAITVTMKGETVNNGGTVTFTKEDYKNIGGVLWTCEYPASVNSSEALTTHVTCDSEKFQFCPMPTCYSPTAKGDGTYTFPDHNLPAGQSSLEIHCNFMGVPALPDDFVGTMNLELKSASESFSFKVVVNTTDGAGVNGVETSQEAVNYADRVLTYKMNNPTVLSLYSITGTKVFHETINGEGTVALSNIVPGVYIYRAGKLTGKICIR